MAEKSVVLSVTGQELQRGDANLAFATAGLADDRVLAELLRLTPYDGTNVYKAVLPYGNRIALGGVEGFATVAPSGSANGSIAVSPFRAIVGSRNAANGTPSPNPTNDSDALANWRDIRSGIFVGGATALAQVIQLAANSSGNPRWDLVYATITVDAGQNTVARRVKDPSSGSLSSPSEPQYNGCPVIVQVVQGTPGATPALPALPADAAGSYNIPLAVVRVPNGFGATTTVSAKDIRAYAPNNGFVSVRHGLRVRPATGNNDQSATYNTAFPWNAGSAGTRPGPFMAPDWVGGEIIIAEVDCSNANPNNWSHGNGSVIDASIDWRNRITRVTVAASPEGLATDPTAGNLRHPLVDSFLVADPSIVQLGNTFGTDGILVTGNPTICYADHTRLANIATGSSVGLYADVSGGTYRLLFFANTTTVPSCKLFFWIECSGQYPNA